MAEHVDGVEPPLRFERVAVAHSCLTYVVEDQAARRYVLRRPPIGHVLARPTTWPGAQDHLGAGRLGVPVAPALGLL